MGGVAIEVDLPSLILHSFEPSGAGVVAMVLQVVASLVNKNLRLVRSSCLKSTIFIIAINFDPSRSSTGYN